MLFGALVNILYFKETEDGQVAFFFLLALLQSELYFRIRTLSHVQTIIGCSFHEDPTTFFHAYMQYIFYNMIYFHVILPKLITQLNCILIKFYFFFWKEWQQQFRHITTKMLRVSDVRVINIIIFI